MARTVGEASERRVDLVEADFRAILERAHEAFVTIDGRGLVIDWNREAELTFGWSRAEAIGRKVAEMIVPERYRDAHERGLARFLETGEGPILERRVEIEALHRDGFEFPIEMTISAVHKDGSYVFSSFLHDISDRRRAALYVEAQQAVTHVLAEEEGEGAVVARLLRALGERMGWEYGAYWQPDESDGGLACEHVWTVGSASLDRFAAATRELRLEPGRGLPGTVWESARPAFVSDVVDDPNFPRASAAADAGLRAAICFPLVTGGRRLGVIEFMSRAIVQPDERLLGALAAIGMQIAQTLESGRVFELERSLREKVGRLLDEQASLRRVATLVASNEPPDAVFAAVAREVAQVFEVELATVCRFESDAILVLSSFGVPATFPADSRWPLDVPSLTRTIRQTGGPARIDQFTDALGLDAIARDAGLEAAVGAPIVVDGSVFGSINIGTTNGRPFPADTEERLAAFTELVSTAISNAEAQRELRRVASEQEALRKAATLLAAGASPEEVFAAITTSASELFEVPFASLLRFGSDEAATMVAGCAACSTFVGQTWTVPRDDPGIVRMVVGSRRPARIDDHSGVHGPLGEAARSLRIGSVVGAPVIVDGSVWGVLAVGARQDGPPLPEDAGDRLTGFTELVTTTLINAETREGLRRLADTQAALRRIATLVAQGATATELFSAVAREVSVVLDAPIVNVDRYELEAGSPVSLVLASLEDAHFPAGSRWPLDGPSARALIYETGRSVRVEDFSSFEGTVSAARRKQEVRWVVGAPIIVDGLVWGNICAGTRGDSPIPDDAETRLAEFTELVSTAIANTDAKEKVGRLLEEQAALRRVATLVAHGVSPDELFVAVSSEVASLFGAEIATVGRFEPSEPPELTAVGVSEGDHDFLIGVRTPLVDWLASTAVHRTGQTARKDVTTEQITGSGTLADTIRAMGFFSTVSAPIIVERDLWGVLTVSSSQESLPSDAEQRIESFTELVATAIANAQSRGELASSEARALELANEQAALRRVATLVAEGAAPEDVFDAIRREVTNAFGVPFTVLYRYDPGGLATVLATDRGYLGPIGTSWPIEGDTSVPARVSQTGRAARVDFTTPDHSRGSIAEAAQRAGVRSGVGAPIIVEGELWGAMAVGSEKAEPLPAELEPRLERFTELLATAISNADSRGELAASEAHARELASEQAALRRVATLVAQGASSDRLFSAVAREVAGVIDIPIVRVNRFEADGTFTIVGIAGDTTFTVGGRWPVADDGIGGMVLATGGSARMDDCPEIRGPLGDALSEDLTTMRVGVPIVVEGSIWGFMVAAGRPGRPIPPDAEERLARFTELVATAVSNATTRTELLASRARLVSAADEARRRLERDLHDGIQQWLVALALKARKAAALSGSGAAAPELSDLADDLVSVTDELREISRGIHPAILSDAGLDDALEALARRSTMHVDVDVNFQGRYDSTLEATVYYVVAESITNAVKHAQASTVGVRGGLRDGALEFEIRDNGVGGADPRLGTGMVGLKDRVETLGGTISFASPAGAGTTVRVGLPARPSDGDDPLLRESDEAASAPASG